MLTLQANTRLRVFILHLWSFLDRSWSGEFGADLCLISPCCFSVQSMREYDRTLIRVRLPGGLIFEAAFHPQVRRLHASSHLLGKASITLTLEIRAVRRKLCLPSFPRS